MARCSSTGALSLLSTIYASDSDHDSGYTSEDERKRKANFDTFKDKKKRLKVDSSVVVVEEEDHMMDCTEPSPNQEPSRIPLPDELFGVRPEVIDDPSLHQGRTRSFPHERGNWASLLYVPLLLGVYEPHMKSLTSVLVKCCKDSRLDLKECSDFHISLSRTLILRLHWIQQMVQDFRKIFLNFPKFSVWMHGLNVFANEEKTRTFLGLKVVQGRDEMKEIVALVNDSIAQFRLPSFYEDCSFHASLLWCNGDKVDAMKAMIPLLEAACHQYFSVESDMRTFDVGELLFKTGNRVHRIPLMED